jgi:hypothetical protein
VNSHRLLAIIAGRAGRARKIPRLRERGRRRQ